MSRIPHILVAAAALLAVSAPALAAPEVKTLEDIRIEGEIRLPRVLFITSRETERPLDFLDLYTPGISGDPLPTGPVPVLGAAPPADVGGDGADPAAAEEAEPNEPEDPSTSETTDTSTTDTSEEVHP